MSNKPEPRPSSNCKSTVSTNTRMAALADIDGMFSNNDDPDQIYEELRRKYTSTPASSENTELLWRLAKSCLRRAMNVGNDNKARRRTILDHGVSYANKALRVNPNDFESLKYKCMLMGQIFDHKMAIKEKAERGLKLYNYLETAAQLNPTQHEILHMQGRLAYSVARLTFLERLAASTLFPNMKKLVKQATFEYAIERLTKCEKITKGTSIDNMFYLAKCYQKTRNTEEAKRCLAKVIKVRPINVYEQELVEESRQMLEKLKKGSTVDSAQFRK